MQPRLAADFNPAKSFLLRRDIVAHDRPLITKTPNFRRRAELLKDDGVMLRHSIGRSEGPDYTNPWIAKYIFPGGYLAALSEALPAIERAGLLVCDIEILRLHDAETLKAWRERFWRIGRKPNGHTTRSSGAALDERPSSRRNTPSIDLPQNRTPTAKRRLGCINGGREALLLSL